MARQFKPKTSGATILDVTSPDTGETTTVCENNEGVENSVETVENSTDNTVNEVVANADIEQKSAVRNVRVMLKSDHTCSIGGTRYFFKKGVCVNVPQEVKDILNKSGLLMPL